MKKLTALLLVAIISFALCAPALAESAIINSGEIVDITSFDSIEYYGTDYPVRFTVVYDYENVDTYTLSIGNAAVSGEGISLTGELYAMRVINMTSQLIILVPERGMSDDDFCYMYAFDGETLTLIGGIPASPDTITIEPGQFTAMIRANALSTWYRPADFAIANNFNFEGEQLDPIVFEIPRVSYPMGALVTAKVDIPLAATPEGEGESLTLKKGDKAIIVSTDDATWLYVMSLEVDPYSYEPNAGWLSIADEVYMVSVNGRSIAGSDAFDGLLYAD